MGQQQIILMILVTVIVGIATVVAVDQMSETFTQQNLDAIRIDLSSIGTSLQAYYEKPVELGGGGKSFSGATFRTLSFPYDSLNGTNFMARNDNAIYELDTVDPSEVVIIAYPSSGPVMTFSSVSETENTLQAIVQVKEISISFLDN